MLAYQLVATLLLLGRRPLVEVCLTQLWRLHLVYQLQSVPELHTVLQLSLGQLEVPLLSSAALAAAAAALSA